MKKNLIKLFLIIIVFISFQGPSLFAMENQVPLIHSLDEERFPDISFTIPYETDPAVKEIQKALSILGLYRGELTGKFDKPTAEAVTLFQKNNGLAPDGSVRYHVWLKLAQESEKVMVSPKIPAPPTGEVSIIIDTFKRRLTVYSDNKAHAQFPIAIGKSETPSPIGNWKIINKAAHWGSGFGTRWLGLNVPWGTYGIHGTNKPWSIGSMASHGCFRMFNRDVETIYRWMKYGTMVTVVGNPFGYMSGGIQKLHVRENGSAVIYVQSVLKRRGFYQGNPDGLFGPGTERAVKSLQKFKGLPETGEISYQEYKELGIQ